MNPNLFFSNFLGSSGISRQNPGISRPKSLISLVSRDIPNFLAPTPSRGRPLSHRKISGLKILGLCSFLYQKKRDVRRRPLRQFYRRLAFFGSFCWKTPMPKKFLLLGGGGVLGFLSKGAGWKCQFYFFGRGDFSECKFFWCKGSEVAGHGRGPRSRPRHQRAMPRSSNAAAAVGSTSKKR